MKTKIFIAALGLVINLGAQAQSTRAKLEVIENNYVATGAGGGAIEATQYTFGVGNAIISKGMNGAFPLNTTKINGYGTIDGTYRDFGLWANINGYNGTGAVGLAATYQENDAGDISNSAYLAGSDYAARFKGTVDIYGRLQLGTTTGDDIYIGINAGAPDNDAATTGNIGIGRGTLYNNNRSGIVAVGDSALYHNGVETTDIYEAVGNTALGNHALYSNYTGSWNTANGYQALYSSFGGSSNTANGYQALYSNSDGNANTANGCQALYSNSDGNANTANGHQALYSNYIGDDNTANGYQALYSNSVGFWNTANGYRALYSNFNGGDNTAIGYTALYNNINGYANTANGTGALWNSTDGNENSAFGSYADVSMGNLVNTSAFGSIAIANANHKHVIGQNVAGTVVGGYANWSNLSDGRFKENVKENVPGIAFIQQLRPVTYTVNIDKLQRHITAQMPDSIAARYYPSAEAIDKANQEIRTGFIAQEVEATARKIGYNFDGINAPTNPTDNYSIEYAGFVPSLVKAIQEQQEEIMSQQTTISAQQSDLTEKENRIAALESKNTEMENRLARLEALLASNNNNSNKTAPSLHVEMIEESRLEQNVPNPFYHSTRISYFVPENAQNAALQVVALDGKVAKNINITNKGAGTVNISGNELAAGTYIYTLYVNGEKAASKEMILSK